MSRGDYFVEMNRQSGIVSTFRNIPLSRPVRVNIPENDTAYEVRLNALRGTLTLLLNKEGGKVGSIDKAAGSIEVFAINEQTKAKIEAIPSVSAVSVNRQHHP